MPEGAVTPPTSILRSTRGDTLARLSSRFLRISRYRRDGKTAGLASAFLKVSFAFEQIVFPSSPYPSRSVAPLFVGDLSLHAITRSFGRVTTPWYAFKERSYDAYKYSRGQRYQKSALSRFSFSKGLSPLNEQPSSLPLCPIV